MAWQGWVFDTWNCGTAVVFGIISSTLALMTLLTIGITKQLLGRVKARVNNSRFLNGTIVVAVLGGLIIGPLNKLQTHNLYPAFLVVFSLSPP